MIDIPMHNTSLFVKIQECLGDLCDDVPGQVFAEICQSDNLVEEFTARTQLEDNVIVLSRFREVNQLDDVGVI
jgi:hypothetical protein